MISNSINPFNLCQSSLEKNSIPFFSITILVFCSEFGWVCRWFMPINILITFIIGSILGWIVILVTRAPPHLRGLILGCCAAGKHLYLFCRYRYRYFFSLLFKVPEYLGNWWWTQNAIFKEDMISLGSA